MFLKTLKLTNFRNFTTLDLDFSQTTMLVGNNAQGKSNLLEAIYFLATSKSPRAEKDSQLIKQAEQFCLVAGQVKESYEEVTRLEIAMQAKEGGGLEKKVKVNGVPRRTLDYLGNLVAIYFSPEDINLVSGPPALRRWHIDLTLAQVDRSYKQALTQYTSALTARNRILKRIKEGLSKVNELDFWTEQMLASSIVVSEVRQKFFNFVNAQMAEGPRENFWGQFRFSFLQSPLTVERIREYLPREIAATASLIGPHRDDFIFKLEGTDLAIFGSRGEQRTAVLELKIAELKFFIEVKKVTPILLLDDVFSELDATHRDFVISLVSGQQTIISLVETEQISNQFLQTVKQVRIEKGKAEKF